MCLISLNYKQVVKTADTFKWNETGDSNQQTMIDAKNKVVYTIKEIPVSRGKLNVKTQ